MKLTDTQLVLLSAASQPQGGALELGGKLQGGVADTVIGKLVSVMAGFNYWFPKAFGFTLDERWGRAAFWCWLVGFYLAFMRPYVLGRWA